MLTYLVTFSYHLGWTEQPLKKRLVSTGLNLSGESKIECWQPSAVTGSTCGPRDPNPCCPINLGHISSAKITFNIIYQD